MPESEAAIPCDTHNRERDSPETHLRILKREWKKYKLHLPKSTSLPALQLRPIDRPLFTCARCGFSNTLIPLCLWCSWTSAEATRAFQESMPRCRRISAPAWVFWEQHGLKQQQQRQKDMNGNYDDNDRKSMDSAVSSLPPITPQRSSFHQMQTPGIASVLESSDQGVFSPCADGDIEDHPGSLAERNSACKGSFASRPDVRREVATATLPRKSQSHNNGWDDMDASRLPLRTRRRLPTIFLDTDTLDTKSITGVDRPCSINSMIAPYPPRRALAPVVVDLPTLHSATSAPQRTLRRKKRMTILKQKSSCSLRARAAVPPSTDYLTQPHNRAQSPSKTKTSVIPPPVRLGHPSRPYYTAIRQSMPRPASPFDSPRPPRPTSVPSAPRRESRSNFRHSFVLTAHSVSRPSSPVEAGFSLSGETELHMALARWRSQDAPGGREYRFKGPRAREMGCVTTVKKLGKGLKDLVLGRT